jgi:hypothetical protein
MFTTAHHWSLSWARWIQSTPSLYFLKIHSNIIFPSTPKSSEWSHPFTFSDQDFIWISQIIHACNVPYQSNTPCLDRPDHASYEALIMQLSPAFQHFFHVSSKNFPQHYVLRHSQSLPLVWENTHTHIKKHTSKNVPVSIGYVSEVVPVLN